MKSIVFALLVVTPWLTMAQEQPKPISSSFADPWRDPALFQQTQDRFNVLDKVFTKWMKQQDSEPYAKNAITAAAEAAAAMEMLANRHSRPPAQSECRQIATDLLTVVQRIIQLSGASIAEDAIPKAVAQTFFESLRANDYSKAVVSGVAYWRAAAVAEERRKILMMQLTKSFYEAYAAWNELGGDDSYAVSAESVATWAREFLDERAPSAPKYNESATVITVLRDGESDILIYSNNKFVAVPAGTKIKATRTIPYRPWTNEKRIQVHFEDGQTGYLRSANADQKTLHWERAAEK